jgi:MFS family permease
MSSRRIEFILFATTGLMAAGYGVMFTVLAEYRDRYGIGEGSIGAIVAAGFFTSFIAQIALAPLADRGHAKRLVLTGAVVTIAGTLGMAYGTSLISLLASRIVMGLGVGMAVPAIRRILILHDPGSLGDKLGKLLSIDVAGFALGPVISALTVGHFGLAAPFLIMSAALALCLPDLLRMKVQEGSATEANERFALDLLRNPGVAAAVLMGLAVFVMIGTFDALWTLVMKDMHAQTWIAKAGISLFALPLIFLGPAGGRLAQRLGPFRTSTVGLLLGAAYMTSYGLLPTPLSMLGVGITHGVSDGLSVTGTGIAIGMVAPAHRQAAAQGLLGGCQTLTGGLAALGAGAIYGATSRTVAYTTCGVVMTALVLGGAVLAHRAGFLARIATAKPVVGRSVASASTID